MTLARARDTLVGRELGGFVLRERIGEGGFGAVYRAHQPGLDREAVIKVLHARLHASKAAVERFLREAKLASKLDHPYAAHIYAFGAEADGELWIAMELVRGTPLDKVLTAQGKLPLERFAPLLDRICEVVHTAHEQGIVHRDLKPANVMVLNRAGRLLPKLLDFGIAKGLAGTATPSDISVERTTVPDEPPTAPADSLELARTITPMPAVQLDEGAITGADTNPDIALTQQGAIMGSPLYMAPEQWLDAGSVGARTDLYALGVLAYECLTGTPPFTGSSVTAIAQAHAQLPPPSLGARFPPALDKVFAKVLAKRPDDRYPDVLAFVSAFRAASGVAAEAPSLPALDPSVRDATINGAAHPIAEAVALLDAARNAYQARDAIVKLARTLARYLGLLALACRSRVSTHDEPPAIAEALRQSYRRALTDKEWLELARMLTRTWHERRDAYPLPELVDAFHGEREVAADLDQLLALREREVASEDALLESLTGAIGKLARVLDRLELVRDYALVVTLSPGVGERWMGVRRAQRATMALQGKDVRAGELVLVDDLGTPALVLAPLFHIGAPAPGAPLELFMFEGRDARGAKLVAMPSGFEHHDDDLWSWFRAQLTGTLDDSEQASSDETPPYRGLSAFSADDGAMFFGREKQIDAFVNRLKVQPLLAVVGPSGAGKSSFVYAGVVPALGWRVVAMRPGPSPLAALVARLEHAGFAPLARAAVVADREALGAHLRADAATRGPLVLVVDQLEEMFTLCRDDDERRAFAEALAAAARSADDPVRVVFTLRDDFLVRTEQVPALRDRIGQGLQLLTVPGAEDLHRIVVEPARRAGYELEGDLAAAMVREVAEQPGALALISFTASKLWELRDRHFKQLTRSAYKALGGVGGALAHHADVTLDAMPAEERALAREAFRHLVTTQSTRAVVVRTELGQLLGGGEHADAVIEKLVAARLLVASDNEAGAETIEIVHEALLFAWPRLVEWRREDSDGARFREQLRAAVKQWDARGRDRGLLWRGDMLAELDRWRARHTGPLTDAEAAFVAASRADAARGRRNRRIAVAAVIATLVAVVVVLVVSNTRITEQKHEAEQANDQLHVNLREQWENQGRLYMLADDPLRGLAALAHAGKLGAHGWGHEFMIAQAIRATGGELRRLDHPAPVRRPRFSHDGTRIVTAALDGKVRIWDAATGKLEREMAHDGPVGAAEFSPDDNTVLSASIDGTARLWDVRNGRELARFAHGKGAWCARFTSDGRAAVTAGDDDTLAVWDLPAATLRLRVHGGGEGIRTCVISHDNARIATADPGGTIRVWDLRTGRQLQVIDLHHDLIGSLQWSTDDHVLIAASDDHSASLWEPSTGKLLQRLTHDDAVYSADLSADGSTAVTASIDKTAVVWDVATGHRLFVLGGHSGGVTRAVFSPDGEYIVTTCEDGMVQLWEAATGRSVAKWRGHDGYVFDASFDPRGRRIVTASNDQSAIIWEAKPQVASVTLNAPTGTTQGRFSRDGARIAIANHDGSVRIYDSRSGVEIARLGLYASGEATELAFDSSGKLLAVGTHDSKVRIWELRDTSRPKLVLDAGSGLQNMHWSADDTTIAAASDDGYVRTWNALTGAKRLEKLARDGVGVEWVTFDATSSSLAVVTYDGVTQLWSLDGKVLRVIEDADVPWSAIYDPAGGRLLNYNTKRTAKILDLSGRRPPIELAHLAQVHTAAWTPDGRAVVTASLDGNVHVWDAETGDHVALFVGVAKRTPYVDVAPDGRVLLAPDRGNAIVEDLARFDATIDLEQLLRCRVPFEVRGDHLELRARDRSRCGGAR